jgi:tRNA(fMet)-specific endonuclease VapC
MICLDTNIVIAYLNGRPRRLVDRFESEILDNEFALSTVVLYELRYGVAKSAHRQDNMDRLEVFLQLPIKVLSLDPEDAGEAGDIRAELEAAGTPIGPYDVLIAGQARRHGAMLVTANGREFARVPGLMMQDWAAS